jgi:hypothetical protein
MCKKPLRELERNCPSCKTDLSLLVDYVSHLREGLQHAESLTKEGQLGDAVWAYLAILEIDPDNATARKQVGKVATAVRQFDKTAPGRRWLAELHKRSRRRSWFGEGGEEMTWGRLISSLLWYLLLIVGGGVVGFFLARWWV